MRRVGAYLLIILALLFCIYRCMEILEIKKPQDHKIFIIGASTVRYDYDDQRMGWGSALVNAYMRIPQNGFNEARRGATAKSYQEMSEWIAKHKGRAYWQQTKALILAQKDREGSYLLIQFGGNDKIQKVSKEQFQQNLRFYIDEARAMGVIPVLISPVETRLKLKGGKAYHSRGAYPSYMQELAKQEHVLFLDLNNKSYNAFKLLSQEELDHKFGAISYPNGRIDRTHFAPKGAKIVAGWVRDLACQEDKELCKQFR
jgi:lysophospholipase L1-like esterase